MGVEIEASGTFPKTRAWLGKLLGNEMFDPLESYGQMGVDALAAATPVETGLSASSWDYIVERDGGVTSIKWFNSNIVDGTPVVILLQYGHGTGTGGYVQGQDFINPAIQPVFDAAIEAVMKEVQA